MPLKRFLTRLIWLSILPLILLAGWLAYASVRSGVAARNAEAANLAHNLATAIDQRLEARIGALRLLASSPLADDPARRNQFFEEAEGFRRTFGSHVVFADTGMNMLFNTRVPLGTALPPLPRPKGYAAAPAALETGAPAVGDIFFGPIAREKLIAIAVPGQRQGRTAFLLLAVVEAAQFQHRLDQLVLPGLWSLALVDGSGATIARRAPAGFDPAVDGDTAERFVVKSALSRWSVVLEIPRGAYRAPLLAAATALGTLFLAAILLGVLGGTLAGRRLAAAVAWLGRASAADRPSLDITEVAAVRRLLDETEQARQRAQGEARVQAEQLRFVADHAPVLIAHCDEEQRYQFVNRAYAEMFGLQAHDIIGQHPRQVLGEEAYAHARPHMEAALAGQSVGYELELPATPGGPRAVQVNYAPERDASGRVIGFLAAILDISARHQAERRVRSVFEQANDGIYIISADNRYLDANQRGLELLGYGLDELQQMSVADVLAPHEVARLAIAPPRMMDGVPHLAEWEHVRKDGTTFPGEVSARRLDENSYLAIVRDLGERRRAEQALRDSEERFRLASIGGDVWDWDLEQGRTWFPSQYWQRLGYATPEQSNAVAMFESMLLPEDRIRWKQAVRDHIVQGLPYDLEYRVRACSGEIRWYHTRGQSRRDASGRATYMAGTTFEITDRKQAEQALRESEERYRSLFENNMDGVLLTSPDGGILAANAEAQRILGYDEAELRTIGRKGVVDSGDPRLAAALAERERSGRFRGELTFIRKDGSRIPVEVANQVFKDRNGRVLTSMLIRDITERKAAEARIHEQLDELLRWQTVVVGREERMLQLKAEVNRMLASQGLPARYGEPESQ